MSGQAEGIIRNVINERGVKTTIIIHYTFTEFGVQTYKRIIKEWLN